MRKLRSIAGLVLVSALLTVLAATPARATDPVSPFALVNRENGLCLQPEGDYYGALVRQSPCGRRVPPNQLWYQLGPETSFMLQNGADARLCMDVRDGIDANGTLIQLWGCRGSDSMVWHRRHVRDNFYKIVSKLGRCLDGWDPYQYPPRTKLYDCTDGVTNYNQQWQY